MDPLEGEGVQHYGIEPEYVVCEVGIVPAVRRCYDQARAASVCGKTSRMVCTIALNPADPVSETKEGSPLNRSSV
jgi:hypothetical protein